MNEKAIIRLVRSATLKINYAGHTILVDPVFADKGTLQSALGVYKSPRVQRNHRGRGYGTAHTQPH